MCTKWTFSETDFHDFYIKIDRLDSGFTIDAKKKLAHIVETSAKIQI